VRHENNEAAEQEQPTIGARALPGGLAAAVDLQTHTLIRKTSPDGREPERDRRAQRGELK
jgi:hypothetical protein